MTRVERGAATAELAVALPALLLVLAVALGALRLGIDRVRCLDAAQVGARLLARGEPVERARALALARAPAGATADLVVGSRTVRVTVRSRPVPVLARVGAVGAPEGVAEARLESAP
ncbi:TadE family type IV pilus minor pilin [Phycicoccus sonneratiae]|uniref:Pilus assembly protein TadE n=1 Tax=Phycicoccus sonneratiae TaxID=2807628 RepID=A0ABS2CNF1_9MICO|nr:TadE family type IV pilus minor pilin [Phycicoccus sonneraticus]MBM6401355.1 pilus assembly protein TadE [Phycicoccus sonneraticus]